MRLTYILSFLTIVLFSSCDDHRTEINYNESGKPNSELQYKGEQLHGESNYYYDNGNIQSTYTYKEGKLHGPSSSWFTNGNVESKSNYIEGMLSGISIKYYENGNIALKELYSNNELHGANRNYYPNGKIKIESFYNMGLYDSTWTYFDVYGRVVGEAQFKLGNGKQVAYYPNGLPRIIIHFENNEKNGIEEHYNSDGERINVNNIKNDDLSKESPE